MVSSGVVVLVVVGAFDTFPVCLLAWISTVSCHVVYVLWVNVLVSLDLLLVGGCISDGGLRAASSGFVLLIRFCIASIIIF